MAWWFTEHFMGKYGYAAACHKVPGEVDTISIDMLAGFSSSGKLDMLNTSNYPKLNGQVN